MNWKKELFGKSLEEEAEPILAKMRDNFPFVDFSPVRFSYLRNTKGRLAEINLAHSLIRVNPALDGKLKEGITHELAHYVAYKWKGERTHGYYWGFVMILMGFSPLKYGTLS